MSKIMNKIMIKIMSKIMSRIRHGPKRRRRGENRHVFRHIGWKKSACVRASWAAKFGMCSVPKAMPNFPAEWGGHGGFNRGVNPHPKATRTN